MTVAVPGRSGIGAGTGAAAGRGWTASMRRGAGVVGEQPVIQPGDSYSYASGCPLGTPTGSMVGGYYMTDASGRSFEAAIPAFSLDVPGERRVLN